MNTMYMICDENDNVLLLTADENRARTFKLALDLRGVKNYFTYYNEKIAKNA